MKWILLCFLALTGGCASKMGSTSVGKVPLKAATPAPKAKARNTPSPTAVPSEPIRSQATSPDGTLSATSTLSTLPEWTGTVTVRETNSGRVLAHWRVRDGATGLAFSPDNKWLAVGGRIGLTVWNWRAQRVVHFLPLAESGDKNSFIFPDVQPDFSPDGRLLAVADGIVELFDTRHWKPIHSFDGENDPAIASDVSFSPDGRRVIASCYDREFGFFVIDVRTFKSRPLSEGDARGKAVFSRDGRLAALNDGILSIWNVRRAKQLRQIDVADGGFVVQGFSPDARFLAVHNKQRHFEVWRVQDGKLLFTSTSTADSLRWLDSQTLELRSGRIANRVRLKMAKR